MQSNENNKERKLRIIIIILLLIILFMLLYIGKIAEKNNLPSLTGNVDVFDIDVNIDGKIKSNEENKFDLIETSDNNKERNDRKILKYNPTTDSKTLDQVFVDDENGNYIYQKNLNIFKNSTFNYSNKIAPGVSNTYNFVVHNSSDMNLNYYLEMYEDTEYKVNLKYRLKNNNIYVIGNDNKWVSANELKTNFKLINSSNSDPFTLEWKWFDDDKNDTIAGKNMITRYKLNIRFYFKAVDE